MSRPHPATRAIRDDLRDLAPYHVEHLERRFKLDANESPHDLPPEIKAELARILLKMPLNRYPDGAAHELKVALADSLGVDESRLAIGNGSDELIAALITALGRNDARVIAPEPTFSMYRILAQVAGVAYRGVPLTARFELDEDALFDALDSDGWNLVFLSYPNNPTGNCWDRDVILRLADVENVVLILDEAYAEFSGKTFLNDLGERPNLIVLRTFSKAYGLAGLRVGYMVADAEWVECVDKTRLPYNVNALSQAAAVAALKRRDVALQHVASILRERDRVFAALEALEGIEPFRTDANFILFRAKHGAEAVFRKALDDGALIRNLSRPGPLENCLRVTIGTSEENDAFLKALLVV